MDRQIFQFKISLKYITPQIWRRILVPVSYSFWDLHVAIQDSMGWFDYHLHEFVIINPKTGKKDRIGIPDDEYDDADIIPDFERAIKDYFTPENSEAEYIYDFGDGWQHKVKLEKTLPYHADKKYPICIGGKRACPPEDCGGPWGYLNLLEALKNPVHENHEEMVEWIGGEFDSEFFDAKSVHFDDPKKRWEQAYGGYWNSV